MGRTETCCITIWGEEDSTQEVEVEYEIETRDGFFEPVWFAITSCKVLTPIVIEPSDLYEDVSQGIRFNEGCVHTTVRMECDVLHEITAEQTVRI